MKTKHVPMNSATIKDDQSFGRPPGGDVGGGDMPNRGQSLNSGYATSRAANNRGHHDLPQPEIYDSESPHREGEPIREGFLNRDGFSTRR